MTAPNSTAATCIECEELQQFHLSHGDGEDSYAVYDCTECDHSIRLDLDPGADP